MSDKIITEEMIERAHRAFAEECLPVHGAAIHAAIRAILPDIGEAFARIAESVHSDGWVQSESAKKWGLRCAAAIRAAAKGGGK